MKGMPTRKPLEKTSQSPSLRIGDLVQYDAPVYPEVGVRHRWDIYKGDVGVVMKLYPEDATHEFSRSHIAEVLFFSTSYLKKSYLQYLKVISPVEDEG